MKLNGGNYFPKYLLFHVLLFTLAYYHFTYFSDNIFVCFDYANRMLITIRILLFIHSILQNSSYKVNEMYN